MKKIIRLTESELTKLVKRIVKEQSSMGDHSEDYFKIIDIVANHAVEEEGDFDEIERCVTEIYKIMHEAEADDELSDEQADEIIEYGAQVIEQLENMSDLNESNKSRKNGLLSEQPESHDISCLLKAGFKKEQIGGPMTRREVYTTTKGGLNYQYGINGDVRAFNSKNKINKQGKWVCSNGGIKILNLKDIPMMPM